MAPVNDSEGNRKSQSIPTGCSTAAIRKLSPTSLKARCKNGIKQHYTSHRMHAVIYSSLAIESLKKMAVEAFGAVPRGKTPSIVDPALPLPLLSKEVISPTSNRSKDKQSLLSSLGTSSCSFR